MRARTAAFVAALLVSAAFVGAASASPSPETASAIRPGTRPSDLVNPSSPSHGDRAEVGYELPPAVLAQNLFFFDGDRYGRRNFRQRDNYRHRDDRRRYYRNERRPGMGSGPRPGQPDHYRNDGFDLQRDFERNGSNS